MSEHQAIQYNRSSAASPQSVRLEEILSRSLETESVHSCLLDLFLSLQNEA